MRKLFRLFRTENGRDIKKPCPERYLYQFCKNSDKFEMENANKRIQ